ncbi:MAG TPA: FAD-dependent oxidoreductase [Solirubrobacteraceae bacterium]|nr:FAD-dependent oxidoreductase [Solirubrobacteraceae bacterium]
MTTPNGNSQKLRVLIAGGGVAALEAALALQHLAADRVQVSMLAPNEEFVYRPLTVGEPFSFSGARHYPLEPIARDLEVELIKGTLSWVQHEKRLAHTGEGEAIPYDALVMALGARISPRYKHALTIDDRTMEQTLHGLIQDVELGYVKSIAFVAPGRMAWPLPLYELALMTAGRAFDMNVELPVTIVTPEQSPLAIFGEEASRHVAELLERSQIKTITSAYAEIPEQGEVVIHPEDRHVRVERVVALPELYGPSVHGFPLSTDGFIRVDRFGQVPDCGPLFACGDATDFAVKQGGVSAQQADVVAESVAKLAGVQIEPKPFHPVLRGMLMTYEHPYFMQAQITGGHGFASQFSKEPLWEPVAKISAKYLAPYLDSLDRERAAA